MRWRQDYSTLVANATTNEPSPGCSTKWRLIALRNTVNIYRESFCPINMAIGMLCFFWKMLTKPFFQNMCKIESSCLLMLHFKKNLRVVNCKVDPLIFAFTKTLISNRLVHLFTRPRVFDRERKSRGPTSIKVVWLRASTQSKTSTIVELHFLEGLYPTLLLSKFTCARNSPAIGMVFKDKREFREFGHRNRIYDSTSLRGNKCSKQKANWVEVYICTSFELMIAKFSAQKNLLTFFAILNTVPWFKADTPLKFSKRYECSDGRMCSVLGLTYMHALFYSTIAQKPVSRLFSHTKNCTPF